MTQVFPCVVWLTGLPGAGKSTLAVALEPQLAQRGHRVSRLDGDTQRQGLSADLGFSEVDRDENIRRAGETAALLVDAGVTVVAAFITPARAQRDRLRARMGATRFIEVFVNAPLAVCEGRDPKGLYARARRGLLPDFTGVSADYETPVSPDLEVRTDIDSVEVCVARIIARIDQTQAQRLP